MNRIRTICKIVIVVICLGYLMALPQDLRQYWSQQHSLIQEAIYFTFTMLFFTVAIGFLYWVLRGIR